MTESPTSDAGHSNPDLALDQQLALKAAASRLQEEFGDEIGMDTIDTFLQSSHDHFKAQARYRTSCPCWPNDSPASNCKHLPSIESTDGSYRRCFFFAPITPAARRWRWASSPGWPASRHWRGPAGQSRTPNINPAAVEAMAEVGIDITSEYPKPWTDEVVQAADVVITMGCGDACPVFPGNATRMGTPDPAGQSPEAVRPIRDEIEARVRRLLDELNLGVKDVPRSCQPKRPEM